MDTHFPYGRYFDGAPLEAIRTEEKERRYAPFRYTAALYRGEDLQALSDAVADLAFAQIQRCKIVVPPYTDEYELLSSFVCDLYTEAAARFNALSAESEAVLRKMAQENYFDLLSSRTVRRHLDKSWLSRYAPRSTFYPLG